MKGSLCSPRPYKLGFADTCVRRFRYCDSNIRGLPEVLKSTSPLDLRVTEKVNGDVV